MNIRNISAAAFLFVPLFAVGCWSGGSKYLNESSDSRTMNSPVAVPSKSVANENLKLDANANTSMTQIKTTGFLANLPVGFNQPTDHVGKKLLKEYGAVFVAKGGAVAPKTVVFKDAAEVSAFQSGLRKSTERIGDFDMELQQTAMEALKKAIDKAKSDSLTITPRDTDAARRSYDETVDLWASRVDPALKYWVNNGRISQTDAARIESLTPFEQVPEIFKLEAKGIYFSKDLSKSIIYSVAPPGTSQHLAMLAFDVMEHENSKVRKILASHGWYQTVISDLPHFTYLGIPKNDLKDFGLKKAKNNGRTFWIPNI